MHKKLIIISAIIGFTPPMLAFLSEVSYCAPRGWDEMCGFITYMVGIVATPFVTSSSSGPEKTSTYFLIAFIAGIIYSVVAYGIGRLIQRKQINK
jgi:hypothetical protein